MAVMHTTMIRASITAYSTAVGPSSSRRKRRAPASNFDMDLPFLVMGRADGTSGRPADLFPLLFPLQDGKVVHQKGPAWRWACRPCPLGRAWCSGLPHPFGNLATGEEAP